MEDTALLTDDEIVALCAANGKPWPISLMTVKTTTEELTSAGIRGMRSLLVRRLAGGNAEAPGFRPHEFIARDAAAFAEATERVGAYIAPTADPSMLNGAAITAARTDDGWVIDSATAAGVHALRRATAEGARAAVLALIESAYAGNLFSEEDASKWLCAVRFGPDARNALAVRTGAVTGTVDGAPVTQWDPELLNSAFA